MGQMGLEDVCGSCGTAATEEGGKTGFPVFVLDFLHNRWGWDFKVEDAQIPARLARLFQLILFHPPDGQGCRAITIDSENETQPSSLERNFSSPGQFLFNVDFGRFSGRLWRVCHHAV